MTVSADDGVDHIASLIWELGSQGALGQLIGELLAAGRVHHALDLLRTLSNPLELEVLHQLAQSRLDAQHEGRTALSWALEGLLPNLDVGGDAVGPHAIRTLVAVLDDVVGTGRSLRPGVAAHFTEAATANRRPDLLDALDRHNNEINGRRTHGARDATVGIPPSCGLQNVEPRLHPGHTGVTAGRSSSVHIAFAFDLGAVHYAQVAINSLRAHTSAPITCHLLCRGVPPHDLDLLATRQSIDIVSYDVSALSYGSARPLSHIASSSTFDRLLLPHLLPEVDRVVYLDADLLVLRDIVELASMDLAGTCIAARPILHGDRTVGRMLQRRIKALPPNLGAGLREWSDEHATDLSAPLVNCGVLVMDLDMLRQERGFLDLLEVMSTFHLDDQDALCLFNAGRSTPLRREWNCLASFEYLPDPSVVHWIGPFKPWTHVGQPYSELWWAAAREVLHNERGAWPICQ